MRIFTAFVLPGDFSLELYKKRDALRLTGGRQKWIQPENFHITLQFMGEQTSKEAEDVSLLLEECASRFSPFQLQTCGPGQFPSKGNPRLIYEELAKESSEYCKKIHRKFSRMLTEECFILEKRKYHPHISLCRISPKQFWPGKETEPTSLECLRCNIEELAIYRSTLTPEGALYTKLAGFPLKA